jgi:peptidoglycan/LPS O-acetylase OafA/YrhL
MFGWLGMAIAGYGTGMGWCAGGTRYDVFTYGLLRGAPAFLTGVVLFRLHRQSLFAGLPVFSTGLLITLWLCIAVVPTFTATPTFDWIAVTLFCPLLVALLIRSDHRMPAFARILGTLSYPLYTVHPGIILLAQRTPIFGLNRGPHPLRAICVVILCVAAAWAVRSLSDIRRPRTAVDVTQSA